MMKTIGQLVLSMMMAYLTQLLLIMSASSAKNHIRKGWMWTDYYPWAYSHETGGWLYFELAKDSDGTPVMNYYDHNSGSWDLYGHPLTSLPIAEELIKISVSFF